MAMSQALKSIYVVGVLLLNICWLSAHGGAAGHRQTGAQTAPAVVVVGAFSNIRYTEEHAYGQAVQLWRQGDRLLGLFLYTDGRQFDFNTGLLEHVMFNPATGELSFDAYASQFHFKGRLAKATVTGLLKRMHPLDGRQIAADHIVLKRNGVLTGEMRTYPSEDEWNEYAAGMLKRLGPGRKS
jgi:hypothetical protein